MSEPVERIDKRKVKFNLMRQENKNKNETKVDDTQGVDETQLRGHKIRDIFHSGGQSTSK
ncbi:6783_t:CDS:1, partial [Ambispora gerdemannii]